MIEDKSALNAQLKRTVKDSLIYIPAKLIPAIIGILLIRVLTTIFSPDEYGHYQITLSTFGLIRVFSMAWLSTSVTRFYLSYKKSEKKAEFFSTLFICSLLGSTFITIISFGINYFVFKNKIAVELYSLINLAIVASIFSAFFEIFVMIFRAGLESKKFSLFWILFAVGKPILGIGLIIVLGFRVAGIFWGFLIIPLLLDLIIFWKLNLNKHLKFSFFSKSLFSQFSKYGFPIAFSMLSFWILSLSDRYFIEFFRGSAEVGFYSVGYTISEKTLNFIYMILMLAAYPIIVDNWEKTGAKQTQNLITELTRYFLLICVPILAVLVTIPDQILLMFSSNRFIEGAKVLPFIAFGVFLNGLTQYVLKGFELQKKSYKIAGLTLLAGVCNICLNLILIPRIGFYGAGISACAAYLIYFSASVFFVRKDLKWSPPYRSIFKIFIAATVLVLFLNRISMIVDNLYYLAFFVIPIGFILFFIILFLLNEIKKYELEKGWAFIFSFFKD